MNADELTRAQCRALKNKLEPMASYLHRLRVRMQRRGFPSDDPMLQLVVKAGEAVHELHIEMQCRAMDGKGFRPE
jgi:hypothetical protein